MKLHVSSRAEASERPQNEIKDRTNDLIVFFFSFWLTVHVCNRACHLQDFFHFQVETRPSHNSASHCGKL